MQQRRNRTWQILSAAFIIALFYIGAGLHRGGDSASSLLPQAHADMLIVPAMTATEHEALITSSMDGKTLYLWTFGDENRKIDKDRLPRFQEAVSLE